MTGPFVGQAESASAQVCNWARNFVRYGYRRTRLGLVRDGGPLASREEIHYYIHSSPFFPLVASLPLRLLPIREWSGRAVGIAHVIVALYLFMAICRRLWGKRIAEMASVLWVLTPMYAYFGRILDHVMANSAYMLAAVFGYVLWLEQGRRRHFVFACVFVWISAYNSFEGIFLALCLCVHGWVYGSRPRRAWLAALPVLAVAAQALIVGHIALLVGVDRMVADFSATWLRKGIAGPAFSQYLAQQAKWAWFYWTPVPVVLGLVWVGDMIRSRRRPSCGDGLILAFGVKAVAAGLVLRGHAATHEFFHFNMLPWCVAAAALVVERIGSRVPRRVWRAALVGLTAFVGLTRLDDVHARRFYANWHEVCAELRLLTSFDETIGVNFSYNPGDFLGGYPQFYTDRRLVYGITSLDHAVRIGGGDRTRLALYVQFFRDPDGGRVVTRIHDLRKTPAPG